MKQSNLPEIVIKYENYSLQTYLVDLLANCALFLTDFIKLSFILIIDNKNVDY